MFSDRYLLRPRCALSVDGLARGRCIAATNMSLCLLVVLATLPSHVTLHAMMCEQVLPTDCCFICVALQIKFII